MMAAGHGLTGQFGQAFGRLKMGFGMPPISYERPVAQFKLYAQDNAPQGLTAIRAIGRKEREGTFPEKARPAGEAQEDCAWDEVPSRLVNAASASRTSKV
jgi:hypothetical protein